METYIDTALPLRQRGGTWLIGKFDGVHRGHCGILAQVQAPRVLTFEPYPAEFFNPAAPPRRLTSWAEKAPLLAAAGVVCAVVKRFDAALAALSPEAFIETILLGELGADAVAAGQDFRFGQGRAGDLALLRRYLPVQVLAPVCDAAGEVISSSRIRAALAAGDVAQAQALLGRPLPASLLPG